jgi:chemotaxis signal transduction protein
VPTTDRQLSVFFEAGQTRYAVEAVSVVEVAQLEADDETVRGHLPVRDLSALLGGGAELRPGKAVVLDTSPTNAVRVRAVEGVFDVSLDLQLPLPGRMIALVTPAIRGALLHEDTLVFVLDAEGVARGLPRQVKRPEVMTLPASMPCLVFDSGTGRYAVPLSRVLQIVPSGLNFNQAPGQGAFLGAVAHLQQLCPVFCVSDAHVPEPLIVLVEANGEVMGLSAGRAEGVKQPAALGNAIILDLEHMFS